MNKEFLEELRLEFSRHDMASESLTKKAINLMTIAGIISALLLGLYTSLLELENSIFSDWLHGIWISVILLITTVALCVILNKAEFQKTPFLGKKFLDQSKNINPQTLGSWLYASEKDYHKILCEEYLNCLVQAENVIETKSKRLTISITLFLIGLITAPIVLGISILL